MNSPTPREVLALCREREIRAVDLRFMDFPGTQKHFTIPVTALTEKSFEDWLRQAGSARTGTASMRLVRTPSDARFLYM